MAQLVDWGALQVEGCTKQPSETLGEVPKASKSPIIEPINGQTPVILHG